MSIEFVDPEPAVAGPPEEAGSVDGRPAAAATWPGRVLAGVAVVAAGFTAVGSRLTLYVVERTASIVDFDGTAYVVTRVPVTAFGRPEPVPLPPAEGVTPSGAATLVSTPDGVAYGAWWTGVAVALLVLAVLAFARPRSRVPGAFVAAAGGILVGSLGAAWLAIRTIDRTSMPQIRFAAHPALGLWLLLAAGGLALLGGLLAAARPSPRRLLGRRRR